MTIARLLIDRMHKGSILGLLLFFLVLDISAQAMKAQGTMSGPPAGPPSGPPPIAGQIVSIDAKELTLADASGTQSKVELEKGTLFLARVPATLASIKPGEAMGVTADKADDGKLTAAVINIFTPGIWKRAFKGQYTMTTGQIMTNAQVDRVVDKVEGKTIYLKYEMLTAAVAVPDSAKIWRLRPVKLADLKPGMSVMVRLAPPGADGAQRAASVSTDLMKS